MSSVGTISMSNIKDCHICKIDPMLCSAIHENDPKFVEAKQSREYLTHKAHCFMVVFPEDEFMGCKYGPDEDCPMRPKEETKPDNLIPISDPPQYVELGRIKRELIKWIYANYTHHDGAEYTSMDLDTSEVVEHKSTAKCEEGDSPYVNSIELEKFINAMEQKDYEKRA
jgi:hypothetical protein